MKAMWWVGIQLGIRYSDSTGLHPAPISADDGARLEDVVGADGQDRLPSLQFLNGALRHEHFADGRRRVGDTLGAQPAC